MPIEIYRHFSYFFKKTIDKCLKAWYTLTIEKI